MDKPILNAVNILPQKKEKKLVGTLEINLPNCEHSESYTKLSEAGFEKMAKQLIENQLGLCGKCYKKHCELHNIKPWYLK